MSSSASSQRRCPPSDPDTGKILDYFLFANRENGAVPDFRSVHLRNGYNEIENGTSVLLLYVQKRRVDLGETYLKKMIKNYQELTRKRKGIHSQIVKTSTVTISRIISFFRIGGSGLQRRELRGRRGGHRATVAGNGAENATDRLSRYRSWEGNRRSGKRRRRRSGAKETTQHSLRNQIWRT